MKRYFSTFVQGPFNDAQGKGKFWRILTPETLNPFCFYSSSETFIPAPATLFLFKAFIRHILQKPLHILRLILFSPLFLLTLFTQEVAQAQNGWEPFYHFYANSQKEENPKESFIAFLQKYRQEEIHPFAIDESLSSELQERHYQIFYSNTYTENKFLLSPRRDHGHFYRNQEELDAYRSFSSYMIRRLGEYRLQKALEKRKTMKKIVEAKENLTNTSFSFSERFLLKAHYSITGDFLDFKMKTPWFSSQLLMEKMTSGLDQTKVSIDRPLKSKWILKTTYFVEQSYLSILGLYKVNKSMEMSMGGASYLTGTSPSKLTEHDKYTSSMNENHLIYRLSWFY